MPTEDRMLSMVVPVMNEQEALPHTYTTLTHVLEALESAMR